MNKRINNNDDSEKVDIFENHILEIDKSILSIILFDRTTNKNILWCTDNYYQYGEKYLMDQEIKIELITGKNGDIIRPRIKKTKLEQNIRIKQKAEVFTPSWICNSQNNLIDAIWFNKAEVFNQEKDRTWKAKTRKVVFKDKTWTSYVLDKRLEISCGEAPYIVSRYDTVTGKIIEPTINRIGILDRKLRIVNENCSDDIWFEWVKKAYQSVYGYEWQGDSLLIARENLLYTFKDYYRERYNKEPTIEMYREIATIISWNIFQMDGLKNVIPMSYNKGDNIEYDLFGNMLPCFGCERNLNTGHTGIKVKIKDWEETNIDKQIIYFVDLFKEI